MWPSSRLVSLGGDDSALPPTMRHGLPPDTLTPAMNLLLNFLYAYLPQPPISTAVSLCCPADDDDNNADRVSHLPDDLLRRVVSLLPAKDGARTTALSSRWRHLWRSTPLLLVDTHLLPGGDAELRPARAGAASRAVTNAVSAALESHPGPFPFASLTCSFMDLTVTDRRQLARCCASLRRLCIGAWVFPDTATVPRGAAFPNLREVLLGCTIIQDKDLEFVLAVSPVLEMLAVVGSQTQLHARLASRSLRCAQFCLSILEEVAVLDAPSLERLFLWRNFSQRRRRVSKFSTVVKIAHAPKLLILGYLEPGVHMLQIGNTIIKAGTKASTRTTVSSVQMLALHLQFEVYDQVKMLPSFLRCFPSIETLIVESEETLEPSSNLGLKFWKDTIPIDCVKSHLKILYLRELQGTKNEFDFLMFIAENAQKLEKMFIVGCETGYPNQATPGIC
ncbi:hypothetical protein QYE76_021087 [Lolium multiflorum]|uniref:F-box domain-containing protein n=1 Tax=Lolium multiflorum TaxID=4521 RepID=A0AAD8R632_LOLMU|nr:hypothetical protein QYE76_021087 [Lolium multiflorum]